MCEEKGENETDIIGEWKEICWTIQSLDVNSFGRLLLQLSNNLLFLTENIDQPLIWLKTITVCIFYIEYVMSTHFSF